MHPLFCPVQIKLGAALDYLFLMLQVISQDLLQIQDPWLTIHQSQHDNAISLLERCKFIELIDDDLCLKIALNFHYNTNPGAIRLIAQIGDSFNLTFFY